MGKRKHKDENPDKIRKKIRRLERRLDRHRKDESDSEEFYISDHSLSSNNGIHSIVSIPLRSIQVPSTQDDLAQVLPDVPNEENAVTTITPALPTDILEALGDSKNKNEIFAPKIRTEISERWGKIIVEGLSKESSQKLMDNIHIPENFKLLKAPELNSEISSVLTESTKNRDKRLEKAQNLLGKGIAGITNLMSTLIDENIDKNAIIKKLSETGQLLLDLHCQNTSARRKLIAYSMDKKFATLIQGVKRDALLFGENLGEKIKASKTAERSGFQMKRTEPQPSTSYRPTQPAIRQQGNLKGPPRMQTQRGRRGGPRNQATTYRRPPAQYTTPASTDRYYTQTKPNNNKNPVPRS